MSPEIGYIYITGTFYVTRNGLPTLWNKCVRWWVATNQSTMVRREHSYSLNYKVINDHGSNSTPCLPPRIYSYQFLLRKFLWLTGQLTKSTTLMLVVENWINFKTINATFIETKATTVIGTSIISYK